MTTVGKYQTYLSSKATVAPADGGSKKAILILPDIFGLGIVNPKLVADMLNEKVGCDVFVPDTFEGGPIWNEDMMAPYLPDEAGVKQSFLTKLVFVWKIITTIPRIWPNRPHLVAARTETFIKDLQAQGYTSIALAGYCFGGSVAAYLAPKPELVKAVVLAHPGAFSDDQIKAFKVPSCWPIAEDDHGTPTKRWGEYEAILRAKGDDVPCEFKIYPGTAHGFAARPNMEKPVIKQAFYDSVDQTADWCKRFL